MARYANGSPITAIAGLVSSADLSSACNDWVRSELLGSVSIPQWRINGDDVLLPLNSGLLRAILPYVTWRVFFAWVSRPFSSWKCFTCPAPDLYNSERLLAGLVSSPVVWLLREGFTGALLPLFPALSSFKLIQPGCGIRSGSGLPPVARQGRLHRTLGQDGITQQPLVERPGLPLRPPREHCPNSLGLEPSLYL
ncbi:hypothetical protein BDR04DRAFT_1164253 [Suillus decipiens]|nr:hypothetical protein BDR04DRAFT_1164253 [Suillus decipiens]